MSRRQNTTREKPTNTTAQVFSLADRRAAKDAEEKIEIPKPLGWRDGDTIFRMTVEGDDYAPMDIHDGDAILTYETSDVLTGDVATAQIKAGGCFVSGYYRPRPDGFEIESPSESYAFRYATDEARIVGRVVGVLRAGEYTLTGYTFRGIYHPSKAWPEVIGA